ncbi:hypothetical protein D3C86_1685920 [compost metagenome]
MTVLSCSAEPSTNVAWAKACAVETEATKRPQVMILVVFICLSLRLLPSGSAQPLRAAKDGDYPVKTKNQADWGGGPRAAGCWIVRTERKLHSAERRLSSQANWVFSQPSVSGMGRRMDDASRHASQKRMASPEWVGLSLVWEAFKPPAWPRQISAKVPSGSR